MYKNVVAVFEEKDFYKQSIDSLRYDGKLLAIPRDISNLVFYVNTEIIEKPNSEWTLDDLLHLSQEAHNKGVFGISFEEDLYSNQKISSKKKRLLISSLFCMRYISHACDNVPRSIH